MKSLLFILILMTYGCGVNFKPASESGLAGNVLPLEGFVAHHDDSFLASAYASPLCDEDIYARLFRINDDGSLATTPVASTKVKQTRFYFSQSQLPLDIFSEELRYHIKVEGCNEVFSRPVTDVNEEQDISYSSTLIGMTVNAPLTNPLTRIDRSNVKNLIQNISGSSLRDAFTNLNSNASLSAKFQNLFQDSPQKLAEAAPSTTIVTFPVLVNEGLASTFKISAFHFAPAYNFAYEWHVDGVLKGISSQWIFAPGADEAGSYVITSIVGSDDGSGHVDRTRPFVTTTRTIEVLDTLPAVAPAISIAQTQTNTASITIKIATGVNSENCESFQSFLLTESTSTPLPSNINFTRSCTTSIEQHESFTLSSGDGTKVVYIWAKDHNGKISSVKSASIILDTTYPSLSLTSPSGTYRGGSTLALNFSASDAFLNSVKIQYAQDGIVFSDLATLSPNAVSYQWSIPLHDTTSAKIKLIATDDSGNISELESSAFSIDSTAPLAPTVSLASPNPSSSTSASLTIASCNDRTKIFLSENASSPSFAAAGWQNCSIANGAHTITLSGSDGTKTIYAWAQDVVGNVSPAASISMQLDTTPPSLSLASLTGGELFKGGSIRPVNYSASDSNMPATPITLSYSCNGGSSWNTLATTSNSGSYSWSTPALDSQQCRIRITATDAAGNSSTVTSSSNFKIDSSAPSFQSSSFILNGGASTSNTNYIKTALSGIDSVSNITHFCLKYNSSVNPNANDNCWTAVNAPSPGLTPALSLNLANFDYLLGFGSGTYTVYAWLKDEVGNISTLSNGGDGTLGHDKAIISYYPGTPPTLINVGAYSTNNPGSPPSTSDLYVPSGGSVFIKWKATDDYPLPAGPVSLYYTTNDSTYNLIATNLANAANGGCTLTGDTTGCYVWTQNITSSYLKIRVAVKDSNEMTTLAAATLNASPLNFLAGNTDTGLNGSAASALFFNEMSNTVVADPGSLVVAKNGTIYFRDLTRGILTISPNDGVLKLLIPATGTYTGNGGNIANATLRSPLRIALDYQDRLLIYDHDRIHRVNTAATPMTISTIIGGGSSLNDNVAPLDVLFTNPGSLSSVTTKRMPFFVLPNGDIYFQSDRFNNSAPNFRVRVFRADTNTVESIYPTGVGAYNYPDDDLTQASLSGMAVVFNPTTSQILHMQINRSHPVTGDTFQPAVSLNLSTHASTAPHPPYLGDPYSVGYHQGRDGQIYRSSRHQARIYRYDFATNSAILLAGTGTRGTCPDGTIATACNIDPQDVFVDHAGQVYFMDRGLIRTITAENKILTLYGQSTSFGDGGNPLSARFGVLTDLGVRNSGEIIVADSQEVRIREFNVGGSITSIAGNGANVGMSTSVAAQGQPIRVPSRMVINSANGDVFQGNNPFIARLDRSTGRWVHFVGGGGTVYSNSTADGMSGTSINLNNLNGYFPIGFDGTNLLSFIWRWLPGLNDFFYKLHDQNSGTQTHLAGVTGPSPGFCSNGTPLASCGISTDSNVLATYDPGNNRWLITTRGSTTIRSMIPGGNMNTLVTLPAGTRALTYRKLANNDEMLYFCSSYDGRLYKYNLTTATSTALTWPTSTVSCQGSSMFYNSARNSLIFIYQQNGLYGVAEYQNP